MRRTIIIVLMTLLCGGMLVAAQKPPRIVSGLRAAASGGKMASGSSGYWVDPFSQYYAVAYLSGTTNSSGLLTDYSVNARHGTNVSATFPSIYTDAGGRVTYAVNMAGSQYIRIPSKSWLNGNTNCVIAFWLNNTTGIDYAGVVYQAQGTYYGLDYATTPYSKITARFFGTNHRSWESGPLFATGRWVYVAYQMNYGKYAELFVDGVLTNSAVTGEGVGAFVQDDYFYIGYDDYSLDRTLKGKVTLVRIYTNCPVWSGFDFTNDWYHSGACLSNSIYSPLIDANRTWVP